MGNNRERDEETPEQTAERVARVVAQTTGREVEGCMDPRDMRGPEWVPSRQEQKWAAQQAQEWNAAMRVRFPGKWVGDVTDSVRRQMDADDAVRRARGMATS